MASALSAMDAKAMAATGQGTLDERRRRVRSCEFRGSPGRQRCGEQHVGDYCGRDWPRRRERALL